MQTSPCTPADNSNLGVSLAFPFWWGSKLTVKLLATSLVRVIIIQKRQGVIILAEFRISTGLDLHVFPREDMLEFIRQGLLVHKSIGFHAVDVSYRLLSGFGEDVVGGIEKVKAMAEEVGVSMELGHLPFGMNPYAPVEIFNQRVHDSIDAMAMLGIHYAVMHPNTLTERLIQFDCQARYDSVMEHLSPFVEHANRVGLNIVIENMRLVHENYAVHRYCGDPEELCKIADALGVGICWDTGHAHINGIKQSEALAYIGSRLKMLHLNDNFGEDDIHLAPFMGTIDWADVMKGLKTVGYNGILNFELKAPGNTPEIRRAFGEYVYTAAQELMRMM